MQPPWASIPDKAVVVNQRDAERMMYDLATQQWSEVPNNDAIYNVHDRTHYADLKDSTGNPLTLAQLRCTVQSIMNTEKPSVGGEPVAMPDNAIFWSARRNKKVSGAICSVVACRGSMAATIISSEVIPDLAVAVCRGR